MRNQKRGYSLVEVLIAIMVLTLNIVSATAVITTSRLMTERTMNKTKAMSLLRARMEWVQDMDFSSLESLVATPTIENDVDNAYGADDLANDTRTTSAVYDADNNLIITITLNWDKKMINSTVVKGTGGNPDASLVFIKTNY